MSETFGKMVNVLRRMGDISDQVPLNKNGKPSRFKGSLRSQVANREVELGLLHYPWKRVIGVDKINQAINFTEKANLDGAVVVGTSFSKPAIEQAYRFNGSSNKRILLMDTQEMNAASDLIQS